MSQGEKLKIYKILLENEEDKLMKKRAKCEHIQWTCKCSNCGQVLDSEKLHETVVVKEIMI